MVHAKEEGCQFIVLKERTSHLQNLSKAIGKTLSSYTQAINIQNKTTGNLFQKKTKAKCLTDPSTVESRNSVWDYLTTCFFYIHNNPLAANIVTDLSEWPYSSWPDYYGLRDGTFCNIQEAVQRMGLSEIDFRNTIHQKPDERIISSLW